MVDSGIHPPAEQKQISDKSHWDFPVAWSLLKTVPLDVFMNPHTIM